MVAKKGGKKEKRTRENRSVLGVIASLQHAPKKSLAPKWRVSCEIPEKNRPRIVCRNHVVVACTLKDQTLKRLEPNLSLTFGRQFLQMTPSFWGRGSGGVQSTGVSQRVRATGRDESQSVPSPEKPL